MAELAFVNGVFGPVEEAKVSIEDRGLQFGDSVYEVIVSYRGRLFLLNEHLRRLRASCEAVGIDYDFDNNPLEPIVEEGFRRCGFSDAMIYIQVTRGSAPRSHEIPVGLPPTVVMTFKALPLLSEAVRRRGFRIMTTPDTRWAKCYIKAVTLLPNVLAKREASRCGYDDALFVTESGEVRECTSANIFLAKGGRLIFPTRTEAILHGITQVFLLDCAKSVGLEVDEQPVDVKRLLKSDEVFMSGTLVEALGVTQIDETRIGDGQVGPITQRLYEEFLRRIEKGGSAAC
ncbi:MAG: aminotransferase class IV [Phycisphaerae bacterium]|jgi:D-alanine transaminase